ncbi:hypothetical protein DPMN_060987 [Dreissena polymorpha]|uniref:Uncharacterized protein n=1 Tax=Dreissena polymorpha TaxID=45954 RepID=A0A9D4HI21_DREPO|nr:hypothetical protein DPMN_060987 [Dreissena polymorpha]
MRTTNGCDSALYLTTFGVLSSSQPDIAVLEEIFYAGNRTLSRCIGGWRASASRAVSAL